MNIAFTKMHGLGNDFMIIEMITQKFTLNAEVIQRLACRNKGVGFDQLLVVETPLDPDTDFHFRIFNADGSEVGQCGNGMRCLARFIRDQKLTWKHKVVATTPSCQVRLQLEKSGLVSVQMPAPQFEPSEIPMINHELQDSYTIQTSMGEFQVSAVSMGNPHAVVFVENVDETDVESIGPIIGNHDDFPEQTNVGFVQILDRKHIRLRVFERGSGETLACGSGACAAMVVCRKADLVDHNVRVDLPGGHLFIRWNGEKKAVQITGPSTIVYRGTINL